MAASSSAESSPEISPGVRYRLKHTFFFNNIGILFAQRNTVLTEKFCCQDDPVPTAFQAQIVFEKTDDSRMKKKKKTEGSSEDLKVSYAVIPVSRDTTVTSLRYEIFDDTCNLLFFAEDEDPKEVKKDELILAKTINNTLVPIHPSIDALSLSFDFVYVALPKQSSISTIERSKSSLQEFNRQLLESGKGSDVTFDVAGEKIAAHKLVLTTRCEHFRSMFSSSGTAEADAVKVPEEDITAKAFRKLLRYLYTDAAPEYAGIDDTTELLIAADRCRLEALKLWSERAIIANLNGDNVIDALILAEKFNCPSLMKTAKAIFGWYSKSLKKKEAWKKLLDNPAIFEHLV